MTQVDSGEVPLHPKPFRSQKRAVSQDNGELNPLGPAPSGKSCPPVETKTERQGETSDSPWDFQPVQEPCRLPAPLFVEGLDVHLCVILSCPFIGLI